MFDDDLYSMFNNYTSTTTDTDENSASTTYSPSYDDSNSTQTSQNPYLNDNDYQDDYSATPNYEEQSSYDSGARNIEINRPEERVIQQMNTPLIKREAQAVSLTKTKQKVYLQARMKIMIAMFITIVSALLFVSIYNFASAGKINASLASKQTTIRELQTSISVLKSEYNLMSDDGYVKDNASSQLGFVESNDSNTITLNYGDIYTEPVIEDLPSNWFNDVCDFFSKLFA